MVNKVTVTQKWYATHHNPKMHPHTKIWIPTSNNVEDIYALDTIIQEMRSKVKVTVTQKGYVTLNHPKMYPHTKSGMPFSNNIGYGPDTKALLMDRQTESSKPIVKRTGLRPIGNQ